MEKDTLIRTRHDGWLRLTLNRPNKLNSLTAPMLEDWLAAVTEAAGDKTVRAILIDANGRAFCAGQDLSERKTTDSQDTDLGDSLQKRYNPLIQALRQTPKPIVCAVNGVAAGAGANLALACDIVLAAQSAVFIQAFSRIGLIPDCGGSWFLPRLAGSGRAAAIAMLAEKITAETAAQWGMIWRVVADEQLAAESEQLLESLAASSASANAATKKLLNVAADNTLTQQLALEAEQQHLAGFTPDYREGVAAFTEKRLPRFNQA